jgi:acetylornithine/succinyldiaminopimelate/putrescine aminotransferase
MLNNRQLFLQHVAQTSPEPLAIEIDRAEGLYLYNTEGKKYMDLISGIAVSNLGHRHPNVMRAIQEQSERYLHTLVYGEFVLSPQVKLATLLSELLPAPLDSCYFVNSGTEATEAAMKLAKRYTGRPNIVAFKDSYHGSTQGAMSLMSDTYFTAAFRPLLPGIKHLEFNQFSELEQIDETCAAVIVETVRAEKGVEKPLPGYLQALRKRCTETGTLLILDEIQVGCGRTGSLFAFEQYGIIPDVLLLAKGFGGGMPIGAFISSREMMQVLTHNPVLGHITTFGGHPLSAAAALATMQTLKAEENELIKTVPQKEQLFLDLLKSPYIKEVRSAGLFMAVQLENFDWVKAVIDDCIKNGLITDWFLFNASALRIAPPLIIQEAEIRTACAIILAAIEKAAKQLN